jgi:hypothetical protein
MNNIQDSIDKYNDPKEYKRIKLEQIREYHSQLIKDLGISPLDFNMKMPFYDKNRRYVVGIFPSEFNREKGFFFELITRDLDPLTPARTVYRIPYNENFDEEYEMNEKGSYLVEVEELRVVNPQSVAISKASAVFSNDKLFTSGSKSQTKEATQVPKPQPVFNSRSQPTPSSSKAPQDALYSEMTIRDYIAIHSGKPLSLKSWLNDLITEQTKA